MIGGAPTWTLAPVGVFRLPAYILATLSGESAGKFAAFLTFVSRLAGIVCVCHGTLSRRGFWQTDRPAGYDANNQAENMPKLNIRGKSRP
jgi:hypothetical protein